MPTKRLSLFLGFNDLKNTTTQEEVGTEGKRSRRFSQLFGFATEETIDSESILVSEGDDIGGKLSRRFSQLFAGATPPHSDEFSLSGEEKPTEGGREKDITTMVFKLFHVRSPRQGSKHNRNVSTLSFKSQPRKARAKKDQVKVTVHIKPFWRQHKQSHAPRTNTHAADTLSLTPSVGRKSRKGTKHERENSVCDSKFSSISSAISFTSLPHELIALTVEQCSILLHLTRKVGRSLQKQERLTTNFSANLAHSFARKESIIDGNKRMSKELRKMLMKMMSELRELVGRTFLKKAVFIQRSLQLFHDLREMLEHGPGTEVQEANDSETTLVPEQRISITIEEVNASSVSIAHPSPPLQQTIDIRHFQHTLRTLREDIAVQQQLDAALRAGIVGPCEDARFPATVSEKIALRRFVAFVDGCLWRAGKCYGQEMRVVKGLEMLGSVLRGELGS